MRGTSYRHLWGFGAVALAAFSGGCGGAASEIRVGVLGDCKAPHPFSALYDTTLAGAELPLIERGGKTAGPKRTDGIRGVSIDGHPIRLVFGCSSGTADSAVAEARRLVENVGVQILIGPLIGHEGLAVREYAKTKPEVTFVNGTSPLQATTLRHPAPNFFRFNGDAAQWQAGLGTYAYRKLGWRNVVTVSEDFEFPYTEIAGFVAEFCALGGNVLKRIWLPTGAQDYSPVVAQIPGSRVDGFVLSSGITVPFVKAAVLRGNLADRLVLLLGVDSASLETLGERMLGVAAASPVPDGSTAPAWTAYTARFARAFPDVFGGATFLAVDYSNAMEAVLQALEAVRGDLSGDQRRFMAALAKVELDAPNGRIKLDANHQAIGNSYLTQVQRDGEGKLVVRPLETIENVEQTFGGYFSSTTSPPSRTEPACKHGKPPPWAR
jgi:branched-chain amino acid transport system substrate-binding protein